MGQSVSIYDTTLRDGCQGEGIALSLQDKLRIAQRLDDLGIHYIEGGWPNPTNPKDVAFFRHVGALNLKHAKVSAFGSTRRGGNRPETDPTLQTLLGAETTVVAIFGKSWDLHAEEILRVSLDENLEMIRSSVAYLAERGREVVYDAEHFFDGYKHNPEFSLRVVEAAAVAGAESIVLCDTNGGSLPFEVEQIVGQVVTYLDAPVGVHLHDDTGCGVANALAGVRGGATQVQGTINGYGERTGNCNLSTIIPNLSLKMGVDTIPAERLERLTTVSHHVAELVNISPDPQQPYVGASAFAHKAGLHVSAIARRSDAYEHVNPDAVGNGTRFVVSELAGKSTLELKAREIGLELDGRELTEVVG
ncbi:MAG TPA: citramalate synthase, partial [Armatimonadota bacterium]|nr:citramalate synthase [Armatimonadota bacterium]